MALTADEEAQVRALLAAVRKLPKPGKLAQAVTDPDTKRAVQALEDAVTQLVTRLNG